MSKENLDPIVEDYINESDFWIRKLKEDVKAAHLHSTSGSKDYLALWEIMGHLAEDQKMVYKTLNDMMHFVIVNYPGKNGEEDGKA